MVDGVRSWANVVADIAHRASVLEISVVVTATLCFLNKCKFAVRSILLPDVWSDLIVTNIPGLPSNRLCQTVKLPVALRRRMSICLLSEVLGCL
jgi:hypothetical protein